MAKRFTDTEKWKKPFFKRLSTEYKLFWNFITDDCDHSGIWEVEDLDIIKIRVGSVINLDTALYAFNEDEKRIHVFDMGRKWFIIPFVTFQYGDLNQNNRLHESVRRELERRGLLDLIPVKRPLNTPKDKDKEKDKEITCDFETFWGSYPKKRSKGQAEKAWKKLNPDELLHNRILNALEKAKTSEQWKKNGGEFIPYPATWLNAMGWEDELTVNVAQKREKKPNPTCGMCKGSGKLPDGVKCWCW